LKSAVMKNTIDAVIKNVQENNSDDPETSKMFTDWITTNLPTLLLNNAYGTLTLEDIDYIAMLYTSEAYCRFQGNSLLGNKDDKGSEMFFKYMEWMKAQGAKLSEDPNASMEYLKSVLN